MASRIETKRSKYEKFNSGGQELSQLQINHHVLSLNPCFDTHKFRVIAFLLERFTVGKIINIKQTFSL